jgi:hypothetical protein
MDASTLKSKIASFDITINTDPPKASRFAFKQFMGIDLPHYMCIRGGYFFEDVLKNMVAVSTDCTLVAKKFLGHKQIDLLFINKKTMAIYYFEVRTNIDNDTEKKPATAGKIEEVRKHISSMGEYAKYHLIHGVLVPTNVDESGVNYGANTKAYSFDDFLGFIGVKHTNSELQEIVKSVRKLYTDQLG